MKNEPYKMSMLTSTPNSTLKEQNKQSLRELNTIIDDMRTLTEWFANQTAHIQNITKTRILNTLANAHDTTGMQCIFDACGIDVLKTDNLELGILIIRFHLMNNKYLSAQDIYTHLVSLGSEYHRKKHLDLLIHYLASEKLWVEALELYLKYYSHYTISNLDIEVFMDAPHSIRSQVLQLTVKQPLYLTGANKYPGVLYCLADRNGLVAGDYALEKFTFTDAEQAKLLDMLKAIFKRPFDAQSFQDIVQDKSHYDYIIDGANVLHFVDREILPHSYNRLNQLIEKLLRLKESARILLVLHARHFKVDRYRWKPYHRKEVEKIISGWSNGRSEIVLCKTPYEFNDDYYSIAYAITHPEALLISNDKFRDHIFKLSSKDHNLDLMAQWRNEYVVEFEEERLISQGRTLHNLVLNTPLPWSQRVQCRGSTYYIPVHAPVPGDAWAIVFDSD